MKPQRFTAPAALLLAFTMVAPAAFAQSRGNEGRRRPTERSARTVDSGSRSQDAGRDAARGPVAVRRPEMRVQSSGGGGGDQGGRMPVARGYDTRQGDQGGRMPATRGYDARQNDRATAYRPDNARRDNGGRPEMGRPQMARPDVGRNDIGRNDNPRYDGRYNDQWRYSNRGYVRYGSYDRDRWRGRVRFGLGVSIFAGRAFGFHFDYRWSPRFNYYYTMRSGIAYGGVSFLLDPDTAEVYIDGEFVGFARDFGGEPVPVAAGYHRIELYAPGFEPVAFDINVMPGQVIPYRGSLYPVYY